MYSLPKRQTTCFLFRRARALISHEKSEPKPCYTLKKKKKTGSLGWGIQSLETKYYFKGNINFLLITVCNVLNDFYFFWINSQFEKQTLKTNNWWTDW